MSAPVPPSDFKDLIPGADEELCGKFMRFIREFPEKFYLHYSWQYGEDGEFTPEYVAMLCAACPCDTVADDDDDDDPPGTVRLQTPQINASDGAYSDRVRVSWGEVADATSYEVYRNTANSVNTSVQIGTSTTGQFDDTTAEISTIYYYWVKARSATNSSNFSITNTGYVAAMLPAVSTLEATQGFYPMAAAKPQVVLVWQAPSGATSYDIYRGTTASFAAAVLIDSDRTPFDNTNDTRPCNPYPCGKPIFVDNGDELVYIDHPPSGTLFSGFRGTFYYWVRAKKINNGQIVSVSEESNMATGWHGGKGGGIGFVSAGTLTVPDQTYTVDAGVTALWVAVRGAGAGGGGGNGSAGGGGGGGGAVVAGFFNVVAGRKIKLTASPIGQAAGGVQDGDGANAATVKIQYETEPGVFTDYITCLPAIGGELGFGSAGGTFTTHSAVVQVFAKNGRDGADPPVGNGGRGGHTFDGPRPPGNNLNGATPPFSAGTGTGLSGNGGGGSYPVPSAPSLAVGAPAANGSAYWTSYAL